eukprot:TRINITY_DN747_c0_g1_i7.p1 TRINITY_DN747_c0_g1~~TRINITY_DN747_c0_g1_i7.p1  ORF type:complete len:100 (+),score=16.12 TRINITY_DN747_c0_g1_i7:70-369(+)
MFGILLNVLLEINLKIFLSGWEETVADIGAMIPYSDPRIRVLVEAILNAKDPHNFELSGEARKYIGIGLEHKLLFVLKASVFFTTPAILEACKIWLKSL